MPSVVTQTIPAAGLNTFTALSGVGGLPVAITSGAGRLNSILPYGPAASGSAALVIDASSVLSGAPQSGQGNKVIGFIPGSQQSQGGALSGQLPLASQGPIPNGLPFFSGLCVAALSSGTLPFTLSYTLDPTVAPQP